MNCQHKKCKRTATQSNSQYFGGLWYCTFHANKAIRAGRILRKLRKVINTLNNKK